MQTTINIEYAHEILTRSNSLLEQVGEIPHEFLRDKADNKIVHPLGLGFDVNRFLIIFDKIHLKKGCLLDYAFHHGGIGGEPLIYARKEDQPRLSAEKYIKKYKGMRKPYLKEITIEISPEAFFQVAVFSQVIHQFYLFWHAAYNDDQFIFNLPVLEWILEKISNKGSGYPRDFGSEQKSDEVDTKNVRDLSLAPQITIKEEGAEVKCVMFSEWKGLYYNVFLITWPEITVKNQEEVILPYDCGICF